MVDIDPHPLLEAATLVLHWPRPLEAIPTPPWLTHLASPDAATPLPPVGPERVGQVRDLLRDGGFKPAGRNKPCNEYIRKVAAEGTFPWINPAVDLTNVAVLHGGLPVSTVDLDRLRPPFRLGIAPPGARYVFNRSGQEIDLSGLLCLFDADGPCANAVKDGQHAKTLERTRRTLTVVWGTRAWPGQAARVVDWMTATAERLEATVPP